jgi:hypothetical protein
MSQELNLVGYGFNDIPEDIHLTIDLLDIDVS